jgi:hypothetical protein
MVPCAESGSPEGKYRAHTDQFLCQERDKQFPIKPSAGTAVVMLGNVPSCARLFSRLNTSSICQRIRQDLRTSAVEPRELVVNTIMYLANSTVPGLVTICFLLALLCKCR